MSVRYIGPTAFVIFRSGDHPLVDTRSCMGRISLKSKEGPVTKQDFCGCVSFVFFLISFAIAHVDATMRRYRSSSLAAGNCFVVERHTQIVL